MYSIYVSYGVDLNIELFQAEIRKKIIKAMYFKTNQFTIITFKNSNLQILHKCIVNNK